MVLVLLAGLLFSASFGPLHTDSSPAHFEQAAAGYRYHFPRDHGSHPAFRTEWWYYTGHLRTAAGRTFGYQLTFFRRAVPPEDVKTLPSQWSATQLYLAHFALTDLTDRRFHFSEKLSRAGLGKAGADASRLDVWIDDWHARASGGGQPTHTLYARDGHATLSLHLEAAKPPVVHGQEGVSRKGAAPGQASHYYSFTRLTATGTVTIGTESFPVTGTSWMDHEFGSADLPTDTVGWDWFSIQLADHTELMLYALRQRDGSTDPASSGTVVSSTGEARHLTRADFTVEATDFWTSPRSRARYPSRWRITIPSFHLSLELVPLLADQELTTSQSTRVTYWEGAVGVTGTKQGQPAAGEGYVELTGYAERITQKL